MHSDSAKATGPRTIKASEFKAKCLRLMDEVAESGEEIVITKNGRTGFAAAAVPGEAAESIWSRPRYYSDSRGHRGADARGVVRNYGRFR